MHSSASIHFRAFPTCTAVLVLLLAAAGLANAAVPTTVAIQGRLSTVGGGAVSDGTYGLKFALYANKADQVAVWSDVAPVETKAGMFAYGLGSNKALPLAALDAAGVAWLGVAVGGDPELPRVPLHAVVFARRAAVAGALSCSGCVTADNLAKDAIGGGFPWAASDKAGGDAQKAKVAEMATDLQCTGCVSVTELKFDGDLDLGGNGLKAKLVAADQVSAGAVVANSLAGDGSKITGLKMPQGKCNAGQVVAGINGDGSLICVAGGGNLPADGLFAVSNGQLTTVFSGSYKMGAPVPIKDHDPIGVSTTVAVPDVGSVKTLSVAVDIANSDISGLTVTLYDPANEPYLLYDKGATGKALQTSWPAPSKTVSGDLSAWIGKNPKGTWRLKVVDNKFINNGNDGAINDFSVTLTWLSNSKAGATGVFEAKNGLVLQTAAKAPATCDEANAGRTWFDTSDPALYVCDGADWRMFVPVPMCGNGKINKGETCDDGNSKDGDGCTAKCQKNVCGDGVVHIGTEQCDDGNTKDGDSCPSDCKLPAGLDPGNPVASCAAALKAGQTKDGDYWLKWGNMGAPIKVWCDQNSTFGTDTKGGWMLYCGKGKSTIAATTCGDNNIPWSKMNNVDYRAHAQVSPNNGWWMSIESNIAITGTPKPCNARMRVKSDIGNWGKTDSGWMNNLNYSPPCGGSGGCWWGSQSGCDRGGIHLRANGNGYTGVDTMANGWTQITHGGGLGALGGYSGGKHTSYGAGGTSGSPADWYGYVR